jgi:uncharacterized membrane protein YkvA (DUF1232 family)
VALFVIGRGTMAPRPRPLIPYCLVPYGRLIADPRVSRRSKVLLAALAGYPAMPVDLVPDLIAAAGQLDDAIDVALILRAVMRGSGRARVTDHWPGSPSSFATPLRVVGWSSETGARCRRGAGRA